MMGFRTGKTSYGYGAAGLPAALLLVAAGMPAVAQDEDRSSATRMVLEVQQLREEVRELRGLVESQQREIENLQRRQRDQYMDLDRRLGEISSGGAAHDPSAAAPRLSEADPPEDPPGDRPENPPVQSPPVMPPESGTAEGPEVRAPIDAESEITTLPQRRTETRELAAPTEDEQAAYDQAFRALRETRYADAAEGFDAFLAEYPDSRYAPNARYWLGEVYYVTRDFETALAHFSDLLESYPESSKQGDALLKVGFSHYELRQWPEARAALEQVAGEHPGTTLARLAENRLRTMRLEGHY